MKGSVMGAAALAVLAVPGVAAAEQPALTPQGSATLQSGYRGMVNLGGHGNRVLVAWRVTVGPGGAAGTVRPRFSSPTAGTVAGDPVELPAAPGTYEFPAPHLPNATLAGLDQSTGGHAIVRQDACTAENIDGGSCAPWTVNIFRGDPPPGVGTTPDETIAGAQLALEPVYEPDLDGDGLADVSDDRTDLSTAISSSRDVHGRLRVVITVTNHGPLAADLPGVTASFPPGTGAKWDDACGLSLPMLFQGLEYGSACGFERLAAGASRTLRFTAQHEGAGTISVRALAEGTELTPADNTATLAVTVPPPWGLKVAAKQRLSRGIKATVELARGGRVRVAATFKIHGRTLLVTRKVTLRAAKARTITLRPHGAKLRSLRRAVRHGNLRGMVSIGQGDAVFAPGQPVRLRKG